MTMTFSASGKTQNSIWRSVFLWSSAVSLLLLLMIFAAAPRPAIPSFEPGGRILVADFREETGTGSLAAGLKPILNLALDQSPRFRLFPESELRESLRLLAADPNSPATA